MDIKFSIITPSIGRSTLRYTCAMLNAQTYPNWEHIVMFDRFEKDIDPELLENIKHPQRQLIFPKQEYNNFGNTLRHIGFSYCTGDYIGYNDDDDHFVPHAFETIVNELKEYDEYELDAFVYPALRFGGIFFRVPPGICHTVTGQWMHKPYIKGKEVRWMNVKPEDKGYLYDGLTLEEVKKVAAITPISKNQYLYVVPKSNQGNLI